MKKLAATTTILAVLSFSCQSIPKSEVGSKEPIRELNSVEGITEFELENGLRVLLFPDQSKSSVTVNITYFVGSRHEGYGEAGMAHLLEHMVFKGTPDRPDIWKALQDRGAQFNGTTWTDRTNYFETLPASFENLEFAVALEADRMVNSIISDEDLQKEFSVVRNEFEMQENNPGRVLLQRMHSAAYLWHNYGQSTIGNRSDIEQVPVENLREFYRRYYQPDNAMLVISGRFEPEQALELVDRHFAPIPRPERELPETYTREPVQDGERKVVLRRTGDVPIAGLLYHIVPGSHEDYVAIEALSHILLNRPSGRLYQSLVDSGKAANIYGSPFAWREPGTFWLMAQLAEGQDVQAIQDLMIEGVEGLDPDSITEEELRRFQNQALSNMRLTMANSQAIAIGLSEWAAMGDWRLMFLHRDRIEELSLDHVRQVAGKYLVRDNRTQGQFLPTSEPLRAPEVDLPNVAGLLENYEGRESMAEGEEFEASYPNIASRTRFQSLPQGSRLAFLPKRTRGQTVEMIFSLEYGTEDSLLGLAEAEDLLPNLMLRGTRSLSYQQLQDRLAELDARLSAQRVSPGLISFRVSTKRGQLDEVVELLGEVLQRPALAQEEFQTLRTQTVTSLQEGLRDPRQLAQNALARATAAFPPGSLFYVPSLEERISAFQSLQVDRLRELHDRFLGAENLTVTVVGDFEEAALKQQLGQVFAEWQAQKPVASIVAPYVEVVPGSVVIDTPDRSGAMVAVAHNLRLNITDESYPALRLAGFVLGGSSNSRILDRLRQREGLAYGAWGSISPDSKGDLGRFSAGAISAPENAERALAYLMEEIERFHRDGVSPGELVQARSSLLEVTRNQLGNDRQVASILDRASREGREIMFHQQVLDRIAGMELDEINEAIRKALHPDQLVKIIAADPRTEVAASH